jgi:eukaryotic-like serine/threonine-protein kinase
LADVGPPPAWKKHRSGYFCFSNSWQSATEDVALSFEARTERRTVSKPTSDLKGIFGKALEIEEGIERDRFLSEACGEDPELRAEIDSLLRASGNAGTFLETPAFATPGRVERTQHAEGPGSIIGPYKLLEQIGEGGMGVVYMAEQTQPVRRTVALKIIKPGMDSRQIIARFEAERQALAMMDHPNIARVLDAGATETGRPYFVMDLVRGVKITEFCDTHHSTPRERLTLLVSVCQAIQHAHQKGIIHRDIKPSNVLVTLQDGRAIPKVIDFGVAKAIDQRLTERTLFTQFGAVVGTPEYMSPEQAELSSVDVDTRSDVYSLGVLMYELLTGTTPLGRRLRAAGYSEILRVIREEEPPKLSTRLSAAEELASIAIDRGTQPTKLARMVRGELDWIAMKALEKDRSRRYETVNGLARDIEHYLADEPVEAGPPSTFYRLRKLGRRHRTTLIVSLVVAIVLVVATVVSVDQAIRAKQQETLAKRSESRAKRSEDRAKKQESRAERNAELRLKALEDVLQLVTSESLRRAGQEPLMKQLVEQLQPRFEAVLVLEEDDDATRQQQALAWNSLAVIRRTLGQDKDALSASKAAEALYRQVLDRPQRSGEALIGLGVALRRKATILGQQGQWRDAVSASTEAVTLLESQTRSSPLNPEVFKHLGHVHNNWANCLMRMSLERKNSKLGDEADQHYRDAIRWFEMGSKALPGDLPCRDWLARSSSNLALLLEKRGNSGSAIELAAQAVETARRLARDFPNEIDSRECLAACLTNEADLRREHGDLAGPAPLAEEALRLYEGLVQQVPSSFEFRWCSAMAASNLAELLAHGPADRWQQAAERFRLADEIYAKLEAENPNNEELRGYVKENRDRQLRLETKRKSQP